MVIFERNKKDTLTLDMEDVGDVYEVQVTSDARYAGSDWNLNTITVTNPSGIVSEFTISEWITDTKAHTYIANNIAIKKDIRDSEDNVFSQAIYYIPANTETVLTDTTEISIGYQSSKVTIKELSTNTTTSFKGGNKALSANLSFALNSSDRVESSEGITMDVPERYTQEMKFEKSSKPRKLRAVYIQKKRDSKIVIGNYELNVPAVVSVRAAGFIEESEE